jgi:hypothetical protein
MTDFERIDIPAAFIGHAPYVGWGTVELTISDAAALVGAGTRNSSASTDGGCNWLGTRDAMSVQPRSPLNWRECFRSQPE